MKKYISALCLLVLLATSNLVKAQNSASVVEMNVTEGGKSYGMTWAFSANKMGFKTVAGSQTASFLAEAGNPFFYFYDSKAAMKLNSTHQPAQDCEASLKNTGEKKIIAGVETVKYTGTVNGASAEYWIATSLKFNPSAFPFMQKMKPEVQALLKAGIQGFPLELTVGDIQYAATNVTTGGAAEQYLQLPAGINVLDMTQAATQK